MPGWITIVKFFAIEKLAINERVNTKPAIPSMNRNIWYGNLTKGSILKVVVAIRSRINKINKPLNQSTETWELEAVRPRIE